MALADVYRYLDVPQPTRLWERSSRNEAANTVVVQIDAIELRAASGQEKRLGIAKVHESFPGMPRTAGRMRLLEDMAFAFARQSWVRAIISHVKQEGEWYGEWRLLPNVGKVVELDQGTGPTRSSSSPIPPPNH